jgi:hypothetical protein
MPEILYPSQTPPEKLLLLPAEGYVQRQEKMSSQDLAYLQKEVQEQWKPAAAIVLVLAIVITVMQLSQNEELIIPQIIMALFGTLVIIAAFSKHYKLQRDLREGKKECTLGLVQHKRLYRGHSKNAPTQYYVQFPNGKEITVGESASAQLQPGDIVCVEKAPHSLKVLRTLIQKAEGDLAKPEKASDKASLSTALGTSTSIFSREEEIVAKRLLRKIGLHQAMSIGKTWLFFSIFIFPFYVTFFFATGDLEDVGLLWQNTKPWAVAYWVAALGLLYFLIQKSLKKLKEDIRHGEKNQRFIVFADKQKAAGNISIKALLIPSPQSSGKSKMLFLIDQEGQYYELQDASLFEQIQVGKAYQLTYLPESRHWLSLREASGQELYSF